MKNKQNNSNATTHGLYAREVVLPWEDASAFAAFHRAIREELCPAGPLEEEAVREFAELQWRKQRLNMGFLLPYYTTMPPAELLEAAKGGLHALARYMADANSAGKGTIMATGTQILDYIKARTTGDTNGAAKLPPAQPREASPRSVVDQAYDPAAIEKYLTVETVIDNRIQKAFARLIHLKEYKKLYGATQALPPAASPPVVPPNTETPTVAPAEVVDAQDAQVGQPTANAEPAAPSGWTVTSSRRR